MDTQQIIELEQKHVLGVYGRAPFVLERGEGATLYDTTGKAYLDLVAGIAVNALGYNDPGIRDAISQAAASGLLHTSNLYHSEAHVRLAQALCATSFADKVHFANSGAEANEGAFKLARRYARRDGSPHSAADKFEILAFTNAFHGRTMGALAATPRPKYQEPFKPLMPGVRFADFNDLESARRQMDARVCAIIVEPLQGEGGIHPATPQFLAGLRALADEHDALLIYDEVQCGMGRTGTLWAYQGYAEEGADRGAHPFAPDILTAAKPLAGGLPIGAILMRAKVADAIHKAEHGSTFAGGPFITSVAHHVLERVAAPAFLDEVRAKGELLREQLEELNSPHILDVRGKGLMVGVELDIEAAPVIAAGYDQGLIMVNAGPNVLRLIPPLIISRGEIGQATQAIGAILQTL